MANAPQQYNLIDSKHRQFQRVWKSWFEHVTLNIFLNHLDTYGDKTLMTCPPIDTEPKIQIPSDIRKAVQYCRTSKYETYWLGYDVNYIDAVDLVRLLIVFNNRRKRFDFEFCSTTALSITECVAPELLFNPLPNINIIGISALKENMVIYEPDLLT